MTYVLDAAVAAERTDDGGQVVTISDDWTTLNHTPNGGYILALLAAAVQRDSAHPDLLSISATFFRPPVAGAATIRLTPLRVGRRISHYAIELSQGESVLVHAVASLHDWDAAGEIEHPPHEPPPIPPRDECFDPLESVAPGFLPIVDRYRYRSAELPGWMSGQPAGALESTCWIRAEDSRPVDAVLAVAMPDAFPPVVFDIGQMASATVQMTVHLRRRPQSVWMLGHITTRHVTGGYHDEDVELWDEQGRIVVQSRQLAILS